MCYDFKLNREEKSWGSLALVEIKMFFRDFIGKASLIRFVILSRYSSSTGLSFFTYKIERLDLVDSKYHFKLQNFNNSLTQYKTPRFGS